MKMLQELHVGIIWDNQVSCTSEFTWRLFEGERLRWYPLVYYS